MPDESRITTDELKSLVETLESETARKEFLADLKALLKAREELAGAAGEQASIATQLEQLKEEYQALLRQYGLDSTLLGRIMVSAAAFGIMLVLMLLVRLSTAFADGKLQTLKTKFGLYHGRFELYVKLLRYAGYGLGICLLLYAFCLAWKITDFEFLREGVTGSILAGALHIVLILAVATVLWEMLNTLIEHAMRKVDESDGNRLKTLLPIARNFLLFVLVCLFTLVILSEVGVDIMPLLAGAGIFGIAIGFGAQTFVKDLLTGFIIIFEDLVRMGDVIKVADRTGTVERITIRKIQLRDVNGIVYTVPFSAITTVENWTKNFSYYVVDVPIAYQENADKVIGYLQEIDESMRREEAWRHFMLAPLEVLGVDPFTNKAVATIKLRIKTQPAKQWDVGREFSRRMKQTFDEKKVELPFPR
jgi:moderate conductance mechanosensitive channel